MAQIDVTPAILKDVANDLSSISSEMKTITNNMQQLIEDIKLAWPDENGKRFAERFEGEVAPEFNKYYDAVQKYSDFIKHASDKYEQTSAAVNSTINTAA